MIIALLVLIIFILLFGAGVVKGWLANAAAIGCGGLIVLGLVLWVGSFLGPQGPTYVMFAGLAAMLGLAIAGKAMGY